jgi:hypothetical protein
MLDFLCSNTSMFEAKTNKKASRNFDTRIYHIKRDINGVAHNCAHQKSRQTQFVPIFNCSNSAHIQDNFPIVIDFQNLSLQGIVLHVVN